jgi:integrase
VFAVAHLVRQQKTFYVDREGKRVAKGTRGAKKITEKSSKWYGQGLPGQPKSKRVPLASDKEAAKRMLDDLVRKAERGQAGLPDRDAGRKSLKEYLVEFESDLTIGLASKGGQRQRPPSPAQVKLVVQRVRSLFSGCGFTHPTDFNSEAPAKAGKYLKGRLGRPRKKGEEDDEGGISAQTATFFLAAARRFARWISAKAPVRPDLFDALPGFNPQNDRRHPRREIAPEELARLIDTTRATKTVIRGLTGSDRAMLYLVAFATGYRAGELAQLCPENFDLEAEIPSALLPARFTKNKKTARQPLPPGLAGQLREYLAGKPRNKPVWSGTWRDRPVSVLRRDLAKANVPYSLPTLDGPKYADFHALRHSYLSALAAAGVGVKELQELARHADPRITLGIYTHARAESLGASVARLQLPGEGQGNPLAKLSRADLEAAVVALSVVINNFLNSAEEQRNGESDGSNRPRTAPESGVTPLVTRRVTPAVGTSGDSEEPTGTKSAVVAAG